MYNQQGRDFGLKYDGCWGEMLPEFAKGKGPNGGAIVRYLIAEDSRNGKTRFHVRILDVEDTPEKALVIPSDVGFPMLPIYPVCQWVNNRMGKTVLVVRRHSKQYRFANSPNNTIVISPFGRDDGNFSGTMMGGGDDYMQPSAAYHAIRIGKETARAVSPKYALIGSARYGAVTTLNNRSAIHAGHRFVFLYKLERLVGIMTRRGLRTITGMAPLLDDFRELFPGMEVYDDIEINPADKVEWFFDEELEGNE